MVAIDTRAPAAAAVRRSLSELTLPGDPLLEVEPGDVLFGNRASSAQAVMNVSKDPWTHCAVVSEVGGELRAVELGPGRPFSRSIADFATAYRRVGVARPDVHPECARRIALVASRALEAQQIEYAWGACAVLESVALARCFLPGRVQPFVIRAAQRAARRTAGRIGEHQLSCAGFVSGALESACPACRTPAVWPTRARVPLWRAMPTVTDVDARPVDGQTAESAIVRLLNGPTDIWVGERWRWRAVIDEVRITHLIDFGVDRTPTQTRR